MDFYEMYNYIEGCNKDFEQLLQIKDEKKRRRRLVNCIRASVGRCGSAFEEQCIIENFKGIYKDYVNKKVEVA